MIDFCFFFFFSSRRRHTRCSRDWSSDVCSSDLRLAESLTRADEFAVQRMAFLEGVAEIGRASCRERVEISGVAGSLKKKKKEGIRALSVAQDRFSHNGCGQVGRIQT